MKLLEPLKKPAALTLAVPFAAMLVMIGLNFHRTTAYGEYRFAIEGYDPVDLLRGHYLRFVYKWPDENRLNTCANQPGLTNKSENCCAGIFGAAENPSIDFVQCDIARQDKKYTGTVPVSFSNGWNATYQPDEPLRQFYIPEQNAQELERKLRGDENKFEVGLVPQPAGGAQLKMLYIDGKPFLEFLEERQVPIQMVP